MKKLAALVDSERSLETKEWDFRTDEIKNVSECKAFPGTKTVTLIKKGKNCKSFIGVTILFLCVSIILTGILLYFYLKSKNNNFWTY